MAKKKCPKCQQTLPVACKSCPCGHIFIAKKNSTSKDTEAKKTITTVSLKRLRPERPKREIPDYEYRDDYTRISISNSGSQHLKTISKKMKLFDEGEYGDDEDDLVVDEKGYNRLDSVESQIGPVKRKRGRPKGSKNKPKDEQNLTADLSEDNEDTKDSNRSQGTYKPSKSKPPKNKVLQLPPVPEDKVMIYSLILSDINERFMSQNKIKCLPGL